MTSLRRELMLGLGLTLACAPPASAAQAPRISKPRPVAPGTPVEVPPLPPAAIDNSLAIGGDDVKARQDSTRLNVEVQINGRGPYRFVVDSGADTSAVGLRIARDLQLPVTTPAILNGMTSRELVDRVRVAQFTLGPSTFHNLEMPALREVDLGGDGLIGIDALVRQRLMMDFEKHVIKVEDALKPIQYSPNDIVIRAKRQRGQLILTEVRVAGLPVEAVIDTGSEITVGNMALRERLAHRRSLTTVDAIGVTGVTMKMELARIGELKLGPVLLRDIPIAFADVPPFKLFGLHDQPAILLGTDMLETFRRVSLDFRARKVRFQLRRCEVTGVVISTAPDTFSKLSSIGNEEVCAK